MRGKADRGKREREKVEADEESLVAEAEDEESGLKQGKHLAYEYNTGISTESFDFTQDGSETGLTLSV